MRIDTSRLGRLVLAGAIAGLIIFIVFNPGLVKDEQKVTRLMTGQVTDLDDAMRALEDVKNVLTTPDPRGAFMFTGIFAAMVGGLLVIVDEMSSCVKRVLPRALLAAFYGVAIGGTIGVTIDRIAIQLNRVCLLFAAITPLLLWPLIGLSAGAAVGLTLGSWRRLRLALIGGLLGGLIGGMAFQAINSVFGIFAGTGSVGRALGFTAMGAIIGASLTFAEEIAKQSWITVLNGAKEGRQYILSKPITTLGRNEHADIPLFGDMSVDKNHACLGLLGHMVTIQSNGGELAVNGVSVQAVQLSPRDTITIGKHNLRFHQRGDNHPVAHQAVLGQPFAGQPRPLTYGPPSPTIVQPAYRPANGTLSLMVTGGPHTSQAFRFDPGAICIGREADCGILLAMDTVVSRRHAEISWNGTAWVVRDIGSTNGVWINGVRVAEHILNMGDQIGIGQTWMRVEGI